MNALPLISHRLLVSTVAERRTVRTPSAIERKPGIIDRNANWNAPSAGAQISESAEPAAKARRLLTPGMISASWPFFE